MKKLCIMLAIFVSLSAQPQTARLWGYANVTAVLARDWAYVMMPGMRYEFTRSDDMGSAAKGVYFVELLTGPVYVFRHKCLTFKVPVWYYYTGFPVNSTEDYFYSHNAEFLPIIEYRSGTLKLTSRTIFHNTFYASIYGTDDLKNGYGLVVRQLFRADYGVNSALTITAAEEPFFGVVEDSEAPPHMLGFWPGGFRMNRVYLGAGFQLGTSFTISPQYVFETTYGDATELTGINHYLFITISYTLGI